MSPTAASDVRVSVIIPVYGTARFVGEAIDSVLAQTREDYAIIVVNDGSRDESASVLAALPTQVPLVVTITPVSPVLRSTATMEKVWKLTSGPAPQSTGSCAISGAASRSPAAMLLTMHRQICAFIFPSDLIHTMAALAIVL